MRKALWCQVPDRTPGLELAQYRRGRYLQRLTPGRAAEERRYNSEVKAWLRLPENKWCQVSLRLLSLRVPATECHHYQGRRGMLLRYQPFWIPVSFEGHKWIDDHREQARDLD